MKSTNNIHRQTTIYQSTRPTTPHIQHNSSSLHRDPTPASHSERHPASNQRNTAQRCNRTHGLETLRIQHKQVNRAAEHGHARGQQRLGPDLLLAGESGFDGDEGDGVDELWIGIRVLGLNTGDLAFWFMELYLVVSSCAPASDLRV
jgi:hypothetical protein